MPILLISAPANCVYYLRTVFIDLNISIHTFVHNI